MPLGIGGGITFGIALGIAVVIAEAGAVGEIAGGIVFGYGIAYGIVFFDHRFRDPCGDRFRELLDCSPPGFAGGIVAGIASGIARLRVYYHPVHLWFVWPAIHGRWDQPDPVTWYDLCGLPFPGLGRLLVAYAEVAPEGAKAKIERLIDTYPSQRHQALIAGTILLARAGFSWLGAPAADRPRPTMGRMHGVRKQRRPRRRPRNSAAFRSPQ